MNFLVPGFWFTFKYLCSQDVSRNRNTTIFAKYFTCFAHASEEFITRQLLLKGSYYMTFTDKEISALIVLCQGLSSYAVQQGPKHG